MLDPFAQILQQILEHWSDHGNGNENVKKEMGLIRTQQHGKYCISVFLYTSLQSLHDYMLDLKFPHRTFYGWRKQAGRNFLSLSEPGYYFYKFNSRKIGLRLTKWVNGNNCDGDWKTANSLLKRRFRRRRHHRILSSLIIVSSEFD